MTQHHDAADEVLSFWKRAGPEKWFDKDAEFDASFHDRFRDLHFAAARQELVPWLDGAESALALILLLDQFPRNCFRGTAHMYATDPLALNYARQALEKQWDGSVEDALKVFFYLPFMHSEVLADQELCCRLCEPLDEKTIRFAIEHRDIIQRFGRFPHRNAILLRETTPEEAAYLQAGGFSG
ncbi:DUF924 family protein [Rhizobium sp. SSA_523]|uniref:DUF924 family protein n=1 Tax=Rhizobium sp. SSA_523 TaxID=2952477 RepID=UPI002090CDE2|nr:DUF924 family protein [Rhizobium sp. SSA_523]MCO5732858.1 DUF924 family protein [Rhizobium sp. SSA_523]WKC23525.1 DUF924 family protein [Rhizobium sp. SSA_523]